MPQEDLDHIPAIVPSRDREHHHTAGKSRPGRKARAGNKPGRGGGSPARPPSGGTGAGIWARLFITVALVVAAVACAWAWQLQEQLEQAHRQMDGYARRISDLEDRLSDTDEGMSQNAAVQAAKIRELDSEVRKLWDNVWKQTKAKLAKLEQASASQAKKISATEKSVTTAQAQLKKATADLARLKSVAGDLERLMSSAKASQAEVERVADTLNRIALDMAKLGKRVQGNEEWVGSINAFRRQMNVSLTELQTAIRALQTTPKKPGQDFSG